MSTLVAFATMKRKREPSEVVLLVTGAPLQLRPFPTLHLSRNFEIFPRASYWPSCLRLLDPLWARCGIWCDLSTFFGTCLFFDVAYVRCTPPLASAKPLTHLIGLTESSSGGCIAKL